MRKFSAIALPAFLFAALSSAAWAQEETPVEVWALNQIIPGARIGSVYMQGDTVIGTNGIFVKRGLATLSADSATVNQQTGEVVADGNVRILDGDQIWTGEHIRYNFKTRLMQSEQFRTGKPPVFAQGEQLQGDTSNKTYSARHAFATTDDVSNPAEYVSASHVTIVPGKYIEMWNAVLYLEGVPTFYFPYYRRDLGRMRITGIFCPATAPPTVGFCSAPTIGTSTTRWTARYISTTARCGASAWART